MMIIPVSDKILYNFHLKNHEFLLSPIEVNNYDLECKLISYLASFYNNSTILDIGTGTARYSIALAHNTSNTVITYDTTYTKNAKLQANRNIKYRTSCVLDDLEDKDFIPKIKVVFINTHGNLGFWHKYNRNVTEKEILEKLYENDFSGIVILYDIVHALNTERRKQMLNLWKSIDHAKWDLSELNTGWPGTGVVAINTRIKIELIKHDPYFLTCDGVKMSKRVQNEFATKCDWVIIYDELIKNVKTDKPRTVYLHTDHLPHFVKLALPLITNSFTLITACSDYSPSVNFKREYEIIINNSHLKYWYTNNNLSTNEKMKSLPAGLSANYSFRPVVEKELLEIRTSSLANFRNKNDRVLCIWRPRPHNDCGRQYVTRATVKQFIDKHPDIFDWYDGCDQSKFYELLASYKYILCPVGNGVDPCPKSWEAMILRTIPIVIRTTNTKDVYKDLPCILVNDFHELLADKFLSSEAARVEEMLLSDETLKKLSLEYWVNKVSS